MLCQEGPFRQVDQATFLSVLRALGHPDIGLIEQTSDGLLLLGVRGEGIVEHYSFYAVFQTPQEYRLIAGGTELGTLPVDNMLSPGVMLIFSGRRWLVQDIHEAERVILVVAAKAGVPPVFGGDPGLIHDVVVARMFNILEGDGAPAYLDTTALDLLGEGRSHYSRLKLAEQSVLKTETDSHIVATRCGSVKTTTMTLALSLIHI